MNSDVYEILQKQDNENTNEYFFRLAEIVKGIKSKPEYLERKTKIMQQEAREDSSTRSEESISKIQATFCDVTLSLVTPEEAEIITYVNSKLFEQMRGYIFNFVTKTWPTYFVEHKNELINECFAELSYAFPRYNGSTTLASFSNRHLLHGGQRYIAFCQGKGAYDNENINLLTKAKNQMLANGYSEEDITIANIQEMDIIKRKKLSQSQIASALMVENASQKSELNPDVEMTSKILTPEEEILKREQMDLLNEVLNMATPYEKYVIYAYSGVATGSSMCYKDISKNKDFINILKACDRTHWVQKDNEGNEFVNKSIVKQILQDIRRKAASLDSVREQVETARKNTASYWTESYVSDLEEAQENFDILKSMPE